MIRDVAAIAGVTGVQRRFDPCQATLEDAYGAILFLSLGAGFLYLTGRIRPDSLYSYGCPDLFILLPSSKRHSTITAVPLTLTISIPFFSPRTS
jgi:hypothetical protein